MATYKFKILNWEKWEREHQTKPIPPAKHGTCRITIHRLWGPYVLQVWRYPKSERR